jgi:hypothetical protein
MQPPGGCVCAHEGGRLFDVDVLWAPQCELIAAAPVVGDTTGDLTLPRLAQAGAPGRGLAGLSAQIGLVRLSSGDQEAPGARYLKLSACPVPERQRELDAAARQPGAQLVGLDRLEQARGSPRRLRAGGLPFQDDDRLAEQRRVQGGTQPESAGADDHEIRVHQPSLPQRAI